MTLSPFHHFWKLAVSLSVGLLLLGGAVLALAPPVLAQSCSVPGTHATIQAAIDAGAGVCDTISVGAGTFVENLSINRSLTINGAGKTSTIIDGNNAGRGVTIDGNGIVVHLNNLRVTKGNATSAPTNRNGGGVLVTGGATLHGENLQIDNNIASTAAQGGFGGGLAVNNGSAYLTSTTVYSNAANRRSGNFTGGGQGGGLYANIGTLQLASSQVLSNVAAYRAAGDEFASGGGLHVNADTQVYLSGNTWQGNVARGSNSAPCDGGSCAGGLSHEGGGAIGASFPTGTANITITKDIFTANIANNISAPGADNASRGGAIALNTTNTGGQITATLSEVTIKQNTAVIQSAGTDVDDEGRGGAIYARHTTLNVQRSHIYDNQAAAGGKGSGGGIYAHEPLANQSLEVINTVLAGNRASGTGSGAQVHAEYTNLAANNITHIVHTTLADDTLNPHEALFYFSSDASDTLAITNTIVASHTVGIQNVNATGAATARYMLFFGNGNNHPSPGTTAFPDETGWVVGDPDPRFVSPAGNDYHLRLGSPAIDAGIDAGVINDIDGDPRPLSTGFDIGADEAGPRLTITKSGPVAVPKGDPVNYTIIVANTGVSTATNLIITDTLPANANYVSAGQGGTLVDGNTKVRWTAPSLPPNSTLQFNFTVTATVTLINDKYEVSSDDGDFSAVGTVTVKTVSDIVYLPAILKNN